MECAGLMLLLLLLMLLLLDGDVSDSLDVNEPDGDTDLPMDEEYGAEELGEPAASLRAASFALNFLSIVL